MLFLILRARIGGVHGRELVARLRQGRRWLGWPWAPRSSRSRATAWKRWLGVSQLAPPGGSGGVDSARALGVYYGVCRALGVIEIDMAIRAFTFPVTRRFQRGKRAD